jgi:membrane protein implicated in regulation of membrane protease activity
MKKELKRNITAFLLAAGMLLLGIGGICLLIFIGVLLGASLPYVVSTILLLGLVYAVSIPIRDVLEDRENAIEYQKKKDEERKRNGWLPN